MKRGRWPFIKSLLGLIAAGLLFSNVAVPAEEPGPLRAGIAKTDITPTKPVMFAGYAGRTKPSEGVHDPLSSGGRLPSSKTGNTWSWFRPTSSASTGTPARAFARPSSRPANSSRRNCSWRRSIPTRRRAWPPATPKAARTTLSTPRRSKPNWWAWSRRPSPTPRRSSSESAPARLRWASTAARAHVDKKTGKPVVQLGRNPAGPTDKEVQVLKVMRADSGELAPWSSPTPPTARRLGKTTTRSPATFTVWRRFSSRRTSATGWSPRPSPCSPWAMSIPGSASCRSLRRPTAGCRKRSC